MADNFKMTITLNGQVWTDKQLQREKYERALHVLHELKHYGVKITDENGKEYSDIDLNWLPQEKVIRLLEKTHEELGNEKTLEVMKPAFDDAAKRWKEFNKRPIEEQGCWLGVTTFHVEGASIQEVQKGLASVETGDTPYKINPEHYGVKGSIATGQTIMEAFGTFGEPVKTYGVGGKKIPAYTGAKRHEDYPVILAGETHLADDDFNIHVGAIHEMKPNPDGFDIISTFFCPKDAPKDVADGHTIHFALEMGGMIKLLTGHFED